MGKRLGLDRVILALAIAAVATCAADSAAMAQTTGQPGVAAPTGLTTLLDQFERNAKNWEGALRQIATSLFWMLAAIQFTWSAIQLALKGADLNEWLSELLTQILFIGFGVALLQHSSQWATAIIASFQQAAENANASAAALAPSNVFNSGVLLATKLLNGWMYFNLFNAVALAFAALIIVICFALIAALEAIAIVEAYIVISASVLFMGFSGSYWTRDYALKIMSYAVSVGAKLFIMQLIVGMSAQMTRDWVLTSGSNLSDVFVVVGTAIVLLALVKAIPDMVQGLIAGASLGTGGGVLAGAAAVVWTGAQHAIGATRAVDAAGALASEQLQDPQHNAGQPGAGWFGRTARNLGAAAARNIGHRVGGRPHAAYGTPGGQMADDLNRHADAQRRKNQEAAAGGNTIEGDGGKGASS
jgi:type IV secretion system protein TrbL